MARFLLGGAWRPGTEFVAEATRDVVRMAPGDVMWATFSIYWSIAAKSAAPTESSKSTVSRWFHQGLWGAAFMLLVLPFPGLMRPWLPIDRVSLVLGVALQAGSVALAVWARRHLGRNWSGAVRIAVDHQLVRTDPYRHLRHPIYTAVIGMFAGVALASGRLHGLLAVALIGVAYWRKIRMEERILGDTFGAEFDAYQRDSWALIPFVH